MTALKTPTRTTRSAERKTLVLRTDLPKAVRTSPLVAAIPTIATDLPLRLLQRSETNPRKTFDEDHIYNLGNSIKQVGISQRLLVRPRGGKGVEPKLVHGNWCSVDHYEIVCGECRYRAAKLIKLDKVPVDIKDLTDEQVRFIQLVENVQRKDLSVTEEAASYGELEKDGHSPEQISINTGKPIAYVRGMLKLNRLPADLLKAVDEKKLPRITAELIARLPGDDTRKIVGSLVMAGRRGWNSLDWADYRKTGKLPVAAADQSPLSVRDTKILIGDYFQVELKNAPFDRKSLVLLEGATSCELCPKRAGNAAKDDEDFKSIRADMCLEPACYKAKEEAHSKSAMKAAKDSGRRVLTPKEADNLFNHWGEQAVTHNAPWVDYEGPCGQDDRKRHYKTLLKGHITDDQVVTAIDPAGQVRYLVDKTAANKIVREVHSIGVNKGSPTLSPTQMKERQENKIKGILRHKVAELGAIRATKALDGLMTLDTKTVTIVKEACRLMLKEFWADVVRGVERRRKVALDDGKTIDAMSMAQAFGLICELLITKAFFHGMNPAAKRFLIALDLDLDQQRKNVEYELKQQVTLKPDTLRKKKNAALKNIGEAKPTDLKEVTDEEWEADWGFTLVEDLELPDRVTQILKDGQFSKAFVIEAELDKSKPFEAYGFSAEELDQIREAIESLRRVEEVCGKSTP